jgi:hypothetical protein
MMRASLDTRTPLASQTAICRISQEGNGRVLSVKEIGALSVPKTRV